MLYKSFLLQICSLFILSSTIVIADSSDNEREAWGGNGGWWGDSRNDWYGEYGTPEERGIEDSPPAHSHHHKDYHPNTYNYNNDYPLAGEREPSDEALEIDGTSNCGH